MLPVSKAHREAAGLKATDKVTVVLELETTPRTVEIPDDLAKALSKASVRKIFDALAPSRRKELVRQVAEAKARETKERCIAVIITQLSNA